MTWEEAVGFALGLPGTELSSSYGQPAVKVTSNGRAFLNRGHEAGTSFVVAIDLDTIELLKKRTQPPSGKAPIMKAGPVSSSAMTGAMTIGCAN